ncbi:MAG: phage integrase N-terminal SAM-like domain-containing protein, partial [Desulfobacterium sp.]
YSHLNMESQSKFRPASNLKLMDQLREVLRYHHYVYRTEKTYCQWTLQYIRFLGGKIHPRDLNALMAKILYASGLRLMWF